MKVMCDCCKDKELEINEEQETYTETDELMDVLAYNEELKRIDIQENPTTVTSENTKNSNFYKDSVIIAETVGEVFQKLIGYGIDYNNALAIASNIMTNDVNLKLAKLQDIKAEQASI